MLIMSEMTENLNREIVTIKNSQMKSLEKLKYLK